MSDSPSAPSDSVRPKQGRLMQSLRDLPRALNLNAILTGALIVIIGSSAALVLVIQAGRAGNVTESQLESWVFMTVVGTGVASILMSLWFRQPIQAAWSTPGAALLVEVLAGYKFSDAVGAFLIAGLAVLVLGLTGLFGRVMSLVPNSVILGMLGGVLLRFGLGLFNAIPQQAGLVIAMIVVFFVLRRINFRAPTVIALIVGIIIAALSGQIDLSTVRPAITLPQITAPTFSVEALLGLAIPMFVLAISAQNAPGLAVLRKDGYDANINQMLVWTGGVSTITSLWGSHGITLAAITAALATGPEAHPDKDKRYSVSVMAGTFYVIVGLFGSTAVALFAALPAALISTIAGLGLFNAISASIVGAISDPDSRDGGIAAFLCTAASFKLLGIAAPFWGLVAGMAVHTIMHYRRPKQA